MKEKVFKVEVEVAKTVTEKAIIEVESTSGHKARGAAEYLAKTDDMSFEWKTTSGTVKTIKSEIVP